MSAFKECIPKPKNNDETPTITPRIYEYTRQKYDRMLRSQPPPPPKHHHFMAYALPWIIVGVGLVIALIWYFRSKQ